MASGPLKPVPTLGIDFGTTTSTACLMAGNREVFVVPDGDAQNSLMPSFVFFTGPGEDDFLIGLPAIKKMIRNRDTRNIVQHIKREMALDAEWHQLTPQRQRKFTFHGRSYRPAEIAGRIIRHLKQAAEQQLSNDKKLASQFSFQGTINTAVITVPAQFGSRERSSTRLAAERYGGFLEVHLLEEPVAAALGLNLHNEPGRQIVMIVDLGGGTLDVTVLCVGRDAPRSGFAELGRIGDNELGGTDWDRVIAQYVISTHCARPEVRKLLVDHLKNVQKKRPDTVVDEHSVEFQAELHHRIQQIADVARNYLLHEQCEELKIAMSNPLFRESHGIVAYKDSTLEQIDARTQYVDVKIPVKWFRETTQILSDWCAQRCDQLLRVISPKELQKVGLKELTWKQIDQIVLVGGGSRLPAVQAAIAKQSGKAVTLAGSPQHLVAIGAARYAEMRRNKTVLEGIGVPRSPRTFGIVQNVSLADQLGDRGLPRRIWWPFGRVSTGQNGNSTDDDLHEQFSTIIETSQASDETFTATYQLANASASEFRAKILENRFSRHHPRGKLYHVSDLKIEDLPPPQLGFKDEVRITMKYGDDHKLSASAECRGKKVDVEITEKGIQARGKPFELNSKLA